MDLRRFLLSSGVSSAGTMLSIAISVVFTLYILRLEPESYGVLQVVISMTFFLLAARGATASYIVLHAAGDERMLASATRNAITFSIGIGVVATLLTIMFAPHIEKFLHLSNPLPIVLIGISALPSIIGGVADGILNVQRRILQLSLVPITMGATKIAAAVILLSNGFQETDAGWICLWEQFAGLISFPFLRRSSLTERLPPSNFNASDAREAMTLFAGSVLFAFSQRIDVLWARHILPSNEAGTYAMMLGIAMVVSSVTSGVARVACVWQRSSSPDGVLKASYAFILTTAIILTGGFTLLGESTLALLAGKTIPIDWHTLMPLFGAMTCYSIIILDYASFNILTKRVHVGMGLLLVTVKTTALVLFSTSSSSIAWIHFAVAGLLMAVFSLFLWKLKTRSGRISRAHPAELHLQHHM